MINLGFRFAPSLGVAGRNTGLPLGSQSWYFLVSRELAEACRCWYSGNLRKPLVLLFRVNEAQAHTRDPLEHKERGRSDGAQEQMMKWVCLLACLTVWMTPSQRTAPLSQGGTGLFRVERGRKWGYIDKAGRVRIAPRFDGAGSFKEGLTLVAVGNKWGYIDESGNFAISPQFESASSFSETLAAAKVRGKGGKWGYIDKGGKFIISPQFDYARGFSEGSAAVEVGGKWGHIDKAGNFVISPQYGGAFGFSEGLAAAALGGKWGFIDKGGEFIISPQFGLALGFSEGLSPVAAGDERGMAAVAIRDLLILVAFTAEAHGKFGYIDKGAKFVIDPQFDAVGEFSEGLATAAVGGKWGYIDKAGKFVVSPQFDLAFGFTEGLAEVAVGNRRGYIDKTGKYVWGPESGR